MSLAGGIVDANNSSAAVLAGAATYTGTATDVRGYGTITVAVDANVDGTLKMQWSIDGTNWDRSKNVEVDQTFASGHVHTLPVIARYFRIVYVNGATIQANFRLQTILHIERSAGLISSTDEVLSNANDVSLVRVVNDQCLDIARELHSDRYSVRKYGTNSDVGTGAFEDIYSVGGSYPWPTAAETVRVKAGGNAADAAAGVGARSVTVEGLDENWDRASETLTMNADGTLASAATTTTFIRVFRAYVATSGAYTGNNTAAINIENTTSTQVLAQIGAGLGQTSMTIYTIPAGYRGYITQVVFEVDSSKTAEVRVAFREDADTIAAPFAPKRVHYGVLALTGSHASEFRSPIVFNEKTDLWVEALADTTAAAVSAHFDLVAVYHNGGPTTPQ